MPDGAGTLTFKSGLKVSGGFLRGSPVGKMFVTFPDFSGAIFDSPPVNYDCMKALYEPQEKYDGLENGLTYVGPCLIKWENGRKVIGK